AREPSDRYQSAEELSSDLQCFLEDRPIQARRAAPIERMVRWCRRNRTVAALTATVAALLVLVSVVASTGYVRESLHRQRAEAVSQVAVAVLDNIYTQFAPNTLRTSFAGGTDEAGNPVLLAEQSSLPLSKDVAVLLENLLEFYGRLSEQA